MITSFIESYKESKYGLIAANASNMETIMAILEASQESKGSVLIQVAPNQLKIQGITEQIFVDMVQLLSKLYPNASYAIHLDHASNYDECKRAIDAGFDSVMIDASRLTFEENINVSKKVVEYAKSKKVLVEAELGRFASNEGETASKISESHFTNPNNVKEFIDRTGIDLLAVSIGNAHGFYQETPKIRYELLRKIERESSVPLVLHGSTGLSDEDFIQSVEYGIFKINLFTALDAVFNKGYTDFAKTKYMMFCQKSGQDAYKELLIEYITLVGRK